MKTHRLSLPVTALVALTVGLAACSKKSEQATAPATPPPAPAPAQPDPAKAIADAAQAKIEAAKKEAEAIQAQAEATAKAKAAELQALADQKTAEAQRVAADLKAQAANAKNSFLSSAAALKSEAAATANATPVSSSPLPALSQNLNPANFSAWYEKASTESAGIISSLATKAAELGSQASPEFKSLYETALAQKKTFDDVSAQLKSGGLTQWAALYPQLQTSWTDLSKSLTDAKALLARFQK